jgi:ribonucleotide reductase beta subunit family protein with ferritin-like domain
MNEVKILESKAFFSMQISNEQIHQDMYKKMLITYIRDRKELEECIYAVYTDKYISKKTKWAESWISDSREFKYRVVAFACVEGIFFCSSFAAIFWLKKRNLMPGLCISNEFISRDECRHTDHAVELYRLLANKLTKAEMYQIINDAVEVECEFVDDCLGVSLIGMNAELMKQYVKYCADRLLIQFGYASLFNNTNPFDFMELISLNGKTNFFEHRVTEYQKAKFNDVVDGFKYTEDF